MIEKPKKQIYSKYTIEDFAVWKLLFKRQLSSIKEKVSKEFLDALDKVGFNENEIPNFLEVNKKLKNLTGWKIKTVPNIAQPREFFKSLSKKEFTATCWLRTMEQIDYLEEPDMFHDVFAHVPLLSNKDYTDFFHALGNIAMKVLDDEEKLKKLQRIYWFTIEFGLVRSKDQTKIYGAGIISSKDETENALSKKSIKREYNVLEIINKPFRIDAIQDTYYVINSFKHLAKSVDEIKDHILK